jgi:predicted O-methyltransferase YrrM
MGILADQIIQSLHRADIYEGFVPDFPEDLHGGGYPGTFADLFSQLKPKIVIEVGSWKGRTAIQFAKLLKQHSSDGAVICVDTWLGCLEHLPPEITELWSIQKYRMNGYPRLYNQFLSNVVRAGCKDCIVPFPTTSNIAAAWLKRQGTKADLIFIDGSHEFDDVLDDLHNYYALLSENGVIFGDDYASFAGVTDAVKGFADENDLQVEIRETDVWIIRKGVKRPINAAADRPVSIKGLIKRLVRRLGYNITRVPSPKNVPGEQRR